MMRFYPLSFWDPNLNLNPTSLEIYYTNFKVESTNHIHTYIHIKYDNVVDDVSPLMK